MSQAADHSRSESFLKLTDLDSAISDICDRLLDIELRDEVADDLDKGLV